MVKKIILIESELDLVFTLTLFDMRFEQLSHWSEEKESIVKETIQKMRKILKDYEK